MILTDKQRDELLEASKPLIKWLNDNSHPHTEVTVTQTDAELKEGTARVQTYEFLKD